MLYKIALLLLILTTLLGCDLREDSSLPSGISPFDIIEDVIYIEREGIYETTNAELFLRVEKLTSDLEGFEFVDAGYSFEASSDYYHIAYVTGSGAVIEQVNQEDMVLVAFKSANFDYLNFFFQGSIKRFYTYPKVDDFSPSGAKYLTGYCYFFLNDSGVYRAVKESSPTESTKWIRSSGDEINLSLYQAQFIMDIALLEDDVDEITFSKVENNEYVVQYDLEFNSSLADDEYNMVLNNETDEFPTLFIPFPVERSVDDLVLLQKFNDGTEIEFELKSEIEEIEECIVIGNCFVILVNNPGSFVIGEK